MRYTAPILAALLFAGCSCTPEAAVQNEPPPQEAAEVPLLKNLPLLGHLFKTANKPEAPAGSGD